ncbi:SDR family oxidoreductase [Actinomadura fulvescens]
MAGTAATAAATVAAAGPAQAKPRRRFEGKVVLITGATSGIGRATAKLFAAEGAKVAFCGRREKLGAEVEREIRRAGGKATYIKADVRVPEQVKSFVDRVVSTYGALDIAFNNAGIGAGKVPHELSVAEWDDVHHTNTRGVFLSIKYEIPHMLKAGHGLIICTSSSTAEVVRSTSSAYSSSKRAVDGIVRPAALAYGSKGIRVNSIMPGTTDTPFIRIPGMSDADWERFKRAYAPLNIDGLLRIAEPEEIANAVVALADPAFSYMTGAVVPVNGGSTAGREMDVPPGFGLPGT